LSPRAAWRLESLGFAEVFDYTAGKVDWLAFGLPVERDEKPDSAMVIDLMEREVPTSRLDESVAVIKQRARQKSLPLCPVVNQEGIVLGVVTEDQWNRNAALTAEEVMQAGPTTLRPNVSVQNASEFLNRNELSAILVTSSDGKLMGIFKRTQSDSKKQMPKSDIWS